MARTKLSMPADYSFSCEIPVRITDINYGGHVGNDAILTLVHEARMQYLASLGYTEMNFEGIGMIMADAAIEFRNELFYPSRIMVSVQAANLSKVSFDLFYRIQLLEGDSGPVAFVRTGMVCYDYGRKKIVALPGAAARKLAGG